MGTSKRLYAAAVALCRRQYADSGIVALCSLRSQLLLALSDAGAQQGAGPGSAYKELCEPDRCHRLALLLEGCVKDGHCEPKRLRDALGIMESLEKDAAASAAKAQKQSGKLGGRGAAQRAGSEASDGGESISRVEDSAAQWLADAGMVLRDPPVLHLLLHETVRTLEGVVEREAVPKDDPDLAALTKLLAYACGARDLLLESRHAVALSRDVLEKFYPLLADVILEARGGARGMTRASWVGADAHGGRARAGAAARQRRRGRRGACRTAAARHRRAGGLTRACARCRRRRPRRTRSWCG